MRFTLKNVLTAGFTLLVVGTILFYAYYQARSIIGGPEIILHSPQNGEMATSSLVIVSGVAIHAKELTLDGRPIFIDLAGNFYEQLLLMEGYNIIELTARDGEGRELKRKIELTYIPEYQGIRL